MNPIIFTSFNDDVDPKFIEYQHKIIDKLGFADIYMPLYYKWHHSEMLHGDILNKFINKAFYERGHDCILIMDVDCIPLSKEAIDITFELAYNNILVGNAQRSCHIENNNHVYAASSYICFTEELYRNAGRPNMLPNRDGDTCEQMTYNVRRMNELNINKFMKLFVPNAIDAPNEKGEYWTLSGDMKYGIGTTFSFNGMPMNYHLFGSRLGIFNQLFFDKAEEVLNGL